jgi:hypothetical protein
MHNDEKNILFYFSWQLNPVHFGVVIEKLESVIAAQKGKGKIYFLYCDGPFKPCYTNRLADPSICTLCRFDTNVALSKFSKEIEVIKLSEYTDAQRPKLKFDYNSVNDIKQIVYKDVNIGYGALSSYISFTRNLEPVMDTEFRDYFDSMLQSQAVLSDAVLQIIAEKNINQSYFFNGRTADTRPLYDICKTRNIPFLSLEFVKKNEQEYFINEFYNCLPHDIDFNHARNLDLWETTPDSFDEKIKKGSSFYENRKNGVVGSAFEGVNHTLSQDKQRLPDNWDPSKNNIGIFISSEDEFAAIGDIFEKFAVFPTQEDGINAILEKFGNRPDYHFYIRVHPNLKKVSYSYVTRLQNFQDRFTNVTVIEPKSKISTYALVDSCKTTVAFGSAVGIEATYWGKPSIILAASWYYHLDVGYRPANKEELWALLEQDLTPKSKIDAIKYGYYLLNYEKYMRTNSFNPFPIKVFGKNVGLGHKHLKVLGSSFLYRIVKKTLVSGMRMKSTKKTTIPRKGI